MLGKQILNRINKGAIDCLVCGGPTFAAKIEGLLVCDNCSFVTTDIKITEVELQKLYSAKYFHGEEYVNYIADKIVVQKNAKLRLRKLFKYTDDVHKKSLFEVGCAYGFFLDYTAKYFRHVAGCDISEDAVQYAEESLGLDAYCGEFISYSLKRQYDIFCLWDTIEHLKYPQLFIEKISGHLDTGGLLAITTGDINSLNARLRGKYWRQIHPPTHLHYFSVKSLTLLLEKNNIEIVYVGHPSSYMSIDNILYNVLALKCGMKRLYEFCAKTSLKRQNILVNMFDLLYIIGRKK